MIIGVACWARCIDVLTDYWQAQHCVKSDHDNTTSGVFFTRTAIATLIEANNVKNVLAWWMAGSALLIGFWLKQMIPHKEES